MEEAIELYDHALEIKPDDSRFFKTIRVFLSVNWDERKKLLNCYDRALEIKPDDYDSLRQKGVSLSELGREEEAIELLRSRS